ncbi:hypothetical protein ma105 [Moumouvirus australiensis]|uniref:Uncharacterized protein n=1 Tax=Moumouvirus australiensis TaxID=2109587 RepID=A0A2P1EKS9_9VIRU|nr:hypothetical protein QKC55_gp799 [Moumouvirus australiensis]AVL94491.1 hypothetical protein ma105 [Moumouvirus australiensis]
MKIYIVWCTDYDNNANEHIIGIYKNKNNAIKKCKKYDDTFEEKKIKFYDYILGDFSSVNEKCKYYCSMIDVNEQDKNIYFLKITEDVGAQHYSINHRIYAVSSMIEIIGHVETWFDEEHNRNKNCPKCKKYEKHLKYKKYIKYIKNKDKYTGYKKYKKYENMNTDSEYESDSESDSESDKELKNGFESDEPILIKSDNKSKPNKSKKITGLEKYESYIKLFRKRKYTICKRKMIKDIYCTGYACIGYTDCEEISIDVWKIKIK